MRNLVTLAQLTFLQLLTKKIYNYQSNEKTFTLTRMYADALSES